MRTRTTLTQPMVSWRQLIIVIGVLIAIGFIWGLASADARAATRCGTVNTEGLAFKDITAEGMDCRKARKFASVYVPKAYACRNIPLDADSYVFACRRTDRNRWFTFRL